MAKGDTRRTFLRRAAGIGLAAGLGGPIRAYAKPRRPKLRVLGTHVTLQEPLRLRAQEELGIDIEFYPGGSAEVILKASTEPESFDLYEQWSNSIRVLWEAETIQPIDTARIERWREINSLTREGRISAKARIGAGDAPHKLLFIQPDGELGAQASDKISFLPYVHNVDSFGYNTDVIAKGAPYETESWAWLLDDAHRGKVAVVNAPTIGLFDLVLAVQAKGLMKFGDIGALTRAELDELFRILVDYRRRGHFRSVWSSVPHSVQLMQSGQVHIESMFSPAVSALNGRGVPCIYAAPKEGYRAWHGVMCMSRAVDDEKAEAAYKFMNWWLSGWPGAFIARQGYYISNPQRSRPFMSAAEWDYWYEGRPAAEALRGTDGKVCVAKGDVRTGGSYHRRFESIAVWNTVMDNYEYSLLKWNEFLSA